MFANYGSQVGHCFCLSSRQNINLQEINQLQRTFTGKVISLRIASQSLRYLQFNLKCDCKIRVISVENGVDAQLYRIVQPIFLINSAINTMNVRTCAWRKKDVYHNSYQKI
jgi:hypothetical protein